MTKSSTFLIGGLVLAAIVYQVLARVPSDALNVALGVLCGIGASIPVSLGLLVALTRRRRDREAGEWADPEPAPVQYIQQPVRRLPDSEPAFRQNGQPQIIVVAPPQGQFLPGQFPQGIPFPAQWLNQQQYPFMQEHAGITDAREWRIIGED